jgi:trimethylamine--corrinoid protein Co-methyltransferase
VEMLLIEEEIIGNVQRIVARECVDAESLAVEQIMALPFGGHYLESPHTLAHFRQALYLPRLADRRSWEVWQRDGAADAACRARARARNILEGARPSLGVAPDRARAVDGFAAEVCHRCGVDPETVLY